MAPNAETAFESSAEARDILRSVLFPHALPYSAVDDSGLDSLARRFGVTKIVKKPLSISGMLVPKDDGYVIVLKEADPPTRQRFSFAHEIGHLVIQAHRQSTGSEVHERGSRARAAGHGDKKEERLCEAIAAELLMPAKSFGERLRGLGQSLQTVPALANAFRTSITSTAIRYCEMLDTPCLLSRWRATKGNHLRTVPDWQLRNEVPGPVAQVIIRRGTSAGGTSLCGPITAFNEGIPVTTYEPLHTKVQDPGSGRTYIQFPHYRTESMGFGLRERRFVLSVTYLEDVLIGSSSLAG